MKRKALAIGILSGTAALFLGIGIPVIINELYKIDNGYITLWSAADALAFYSVILSGLFSMGILAITIRYNKKETERQVQAAFSQIKAPFFIVYGIFSDSRNSCACNTKGNSKVIQYTLSKYEPVRVTIQLKNIGDGPAISLHYTTKQAAVQISCKDSHIANQISIYVQSNDLVELNCDLSKFLSTDNINYHPQVIDTEISLTYKNTFGISYLQNIVLKIEKVPNIPKTVLLSVEEFSYQTIQSDR